MKGSSKPISSPRRTEKFPPPLMRFLRSNVGSKSSRGRSIRASPIFMRKNKENMIVQTTQEPSSPKVTCIGQVRVRRTSNGIAKKRKQQQRRGGEGKEEGPRCCCNFTILKLHRPKSLISGLKKWVCWLNFRRKVESTEKVGTTKTNFEIEIFESEGTDGYVDSNSNSNPNPNPPKNALILTRCRSAPYRSSSLASKFWGSPLNHDNNIRESEEEEEEEEKPPPPPILEKEKPIMPEDIIGDLDSKKSCENEETQSSSINEETVKANYVHPLLLTRCKSEPARTGERLNPTRFSETNPPS